MQSQAAVIPNSQQHESPLAYQFDMDDLTSTGLEPDGMAEVIELNPAIKLMILQSLDGFCFCCYQTWDLKIQPPPNVLRF